MPQATALRWTHPLSNKKIIKQEELIMAEFTVDCLGEACPVPLMKVQKQMEKMAVGDVLIAQIDHSCAMKNIPEWARNNGHNVEIEEVDDGEWEIVIEKTK
jgi:TusA-related sulfurtransferase